MEYKPSGLFQLVAQGDDVKLQRLLLEAKEERNVATLAHGNTVLHEAAWNGFSRCVRVLCRVYPKNLDDNSNKEQLRCMKNDFINRVNFCGFSALHLAAQNGHNQTLRELLYAGCSTSIHNDYGDTPLHTACRYGHAGVVRILISAKSDVDSFNLNHDTPLHITCAMGRRKLTKLLLEADAMQFQNLHHEFPSDIATRKKLREITEILTTYKDKLEKTKLQRAANNMNSEQLLPQSSKLKYNNRQHWSPYGCHYYPDTRNFPSPNIESLPKEPLEKGEQYYLDLAGNICKGPIGHEKTCCCDMLDKKEKCRNFQTADRNGTTLDTKIKALANKFERTKIRLSKPQKSIRKNSDPLYPLLRIVGDKSKRIHMKQWLHKVQFGSISDLQSKELLKGTSEEVAVDFHRESIQEDNPTFSESKKMLTFDKKGNDLTLSTQEGEDENYTDISNESDDESENCSIASINENRLYDENFMQNFQRQQLSHVTHLAESLTSPSISSNQNIEHEMDRITKSLLMGGLMISTNPDVIRDHIHHSAKRSTNKTKSAITKSTVLTSGELYVNTFFRNSEAVFVDNAVIMSSPSLDEIQSIVRGKNELDNRQAWNQAVRSRNPLPMDIDELEKLPENIPRLKESFIDSSNLNDNNFVLLEKLLKARKTFNQNYQQQLQVMSKNLKKVPAVSPLNEDRQKTNIPSSSTLV